MLRRLRRLVGARMAQSMVHMPAFNPSASAGAGADAGAQDGAQLSQQLALLAPLFQYRAVDRGERLCVAGEACPAVHVLVKGGLGVESKMKQRQARVDCCGVIEGAATATVVATRRSIVLTLPERHFERFKQQAPVSGRCGAAFLCCSRACFVWLLPSFCSLLSSCRVCRGWSRSGSAHDARANNLESACGM